jgi:hypothetical protein
MSTALNQLRPVTMWTIDLTEEVIDSVLHGALCVLCTSGVYCAVANVALKWRVLKGKACTLTLRRLQHLDHAFKGHTLSTDCTIFEFGSGNTLRGQGCLQCMLLTHGTALTS